MVAILPSITRAGFIVLTLVMYTLVLMELKKAMAKTAWSESQKRSMYNRAQFAIIVWLVLISVLALTGFLGNFSSFPPRIIIVLAIPLISVIILMFSGNVRELLTHVPVQNIVRLQVFRVFVEILLWLLFIQNAMPVQMSFEGRNFDVLAGLTAPLAAIFLVRSRVALIIWNFLGLGLLLNIVIIAILSMPTPLRYFMNEPSNTIVAEFPYVLLPGLLVPLAYGLHFLSLKQLIMKEK